MPRGPKSRSKKAWRNADAEELEPETERSSQLRDSELFFVDTAGAVDSETQNRSAKKRKAPSTGVLGEGKGEQVSADEKQISKHPQKKGTAKPSKHKKRKVEGQSQAPEPTLSDLWSNESSLSSKPSVNQKGFPVAIVKATVSRRKGRERKLTKQGLQTDVPQGGSSFNPEPAQREELVKQAAERERLEREERERRSAKLRGDEAAFGLPLSKSNSAIPASTEGTEGTEGREGSEDSDSGDNGEEEGQEEEEARSAQSRVVSDKKKTKAQRNKEKRKKQQEEERKKASLNQSLKQSLRRLPQIVAELTKEEQLQQSRLEEAKSLPKHEKVRLGKHSLEEPFPEVLLSDELNNGSLRALKASTETLNRQFARFQHNRLIEPQKRVKKHKRRYKLKYYTKAQHKETEA